MDSVLELDTPLVAVKAAVVQLGELGQRMRRYEFNFRETDVASIDQIIACLTELEDERQHTHDQFESESITASILRHKLATFAEEIQQQLTEAMAAARESNQGALNALQQQLEDMSLEAQQLRDQLEQHERQNDEFRPLRKAIFQEYEEHIAMLNQCLTQKADLQILLNETRDKVRETNQKIIDLEEGIILLKEDLIQERADAREQKMQMKTEIIETTVKAKEQKLRNKAQQVHVDRAEHDLMRSEAKLNVLRTSIAEYESLYAALAAEAAELQALQDALHEENLQLRMRLTRLNNAIARETLQFQKEQDVKLEIKSKLVEETGDAKKKQADQKQRKNMLKEELQKAKVHRIEDSEKISELQTGLGRSKQNLADLAEDVGRLTIDNMDSNDNIEQMIDQHKIFMAQINKQIDELRATLAKERKSRVELQSRHEFIGKDQSEKKLHAQKKLQRLTQELAALKQNLHTLVKEKTITETCVAELDTNIVTLKREVTEAQMEHDRTKSERELEVSKTEREIEEMKMQIAAHRAFLVHGEPQFDELTALYDNETEAYTDKKKKLVVLRNEQKGSSETCQRHQTQISKHEAPFLQLKASLTQRRQRALDLLQQHSDDVRLLETDIHNGALRLSAVNDENDTLQKGVDELDVQLRELDERSVDNDRRTSKLKEDITRSRGELEAKWDQDRDIQEEFAARDELVVGALGRLLKETETRSGRIAGITQHLEKELAVLTSFMQKVERRRPPDENLTSHF